MRGLGSGGGTGADLSEVLPFAGGGGGKRPGDRSVSGAGDHKETGRLC